MCDDHYVAGIDDADDPGVAGSTSEQGRTVARLLALPPGHRRALPNPDNPYRPELHVLARIASMRRAVERIDRSPIAVTDCDELSHADIDAILLMGATLIPRRPWEVRGTSGFVLMAERRGPSIVFLEPDRYPLRAPLSFPHAHRLAARLRAAVGEDVEASTGPLIDDPGWEGIALQRRQSQVDVRLRALGFDRDVVLEAGDAAHLADLLEQAVSFGPH